MSSSVGDEFSYDSQADEYIKKTLPQYSVILIDIQKGVVLLGLKQNISSIYLALIMTL